MGESVGRWVALNTNSLINKTTAHLTYFYTPNLCYFCEQQKKGCRDNREKGCQVFQVHFVVVGGMLVAMDGGRLVDVVGRSRLYNTHAYAGSGRVGRRSHSTQHTMS